MRPAIRKARLLLDERHQLRAEAFASLRVWHVPQPVRASRHDYKYALAYVVSGVCVLRYDNEAGKGDRKHVGTVETGYHFRSPEQLLTDFWRDVDRWRPECVL
jgi:hypothetical protein